MAFCAVFAAFLTFLVSLWLITATVAFAPPLGVPAINPSMSQRAAMQLVHVTDFASKSASYNQAKHAAQMLHLNKCETAAQLLHTCTHFAQMH